MIRLALAAAALLGLAFAPAPVPFTLTSSAFANGAAIPVAYTCDGAGNSEALRWQGAPRGTKSFALALFDPDARPPKGFVHWVAYDLPADRHAIASGKYDSADLTGGGIEGDNGRGKLGFTPSCPGLGAPHHYTFTLYALDVPTLGLAPGATRDQMLSAMQGKILGQAELVGLYTRGPRP